MSSVVTLPKSAVHGAMALVGLAAFVTGLCGARALAPWPYEWQACLAVMAWVTVLLLGADLAVNRVHRRASTGLDFTRRDPSLERTAVKFLGLLATLALLGLGYMSFPLYADPFYAPFFSMLPWLVLPWLVAALPYIYLVDRCMRAPHDGYWQMGQALLLRWRAVDRRVLGQYLLGWLVKGFFLPLMFVYLCGDMAELLGYVALPGGTKPLYDAAFTAMYFADVALVSVGYLVTFRVTDTHIRSTEPTLLGWAVALACYQPFWGLVSGDFLRYRTDLDWQRWLAPRPAAYLGWGAVILLLTAVYLWATLAFAGRFSNLTHRGIITNGPYRFTKHPAYVAKNLSWWLISVPFLAQGGWRDGLLRCLMLLGVNVIYWLRARTEERHLSQDPVYVQYALWMEQHGLLRHIPRLKGLGFLRYRIPEH